MSYMPESAFSSHDSKRLEAERRACRMIPAHASKKDFLEMLGDEVETIVSCVTAEDIRAMKRNADAAKDIPASVIRCLAAKANATA